MSKFFTIYNDVSFSDIDHYMLYRVKLQLMYIQQLRYRCRFIKSTESQYELLYNLLYDRTVIECSSINVDNKIELLRARINTNIMLNTVPIAIIIKDLEELFGTCVFFEIRLLGSGLLRVDEVVLLYKFVDFFITRSNTYNINLSQFVYVIFFSLVGMDLHALLRCFGDMFECVHYSETLEVYHYIIDILCYFYNYCSSRLGFVGIRIDVSGKFSKQLSTKRRRYSYIIGRHSSSIMYGCNYCYRQM